MQANQPVKNTPTKKKNNKHKETIKLPRRHESHVCLLPKAHRADCIWYGHLHHHYPAQILNSQWALTQWTPAHWDRVRWRSYVHGNTNWSQHQEMVSDHSSTAFTIPVVPFHKCSYFPLQDTSVTCPITQKNKADQTTEKCTCEGRKTRIIICNTTASKQLHSAWISLQ